MNDKSDRPTQDRTSISLSEENDVQYWTKALGISKHRLTQAVEKVGNSADAVRKELGDIIT